MTLEGYLKEYKALTLDLMEKINTSGNIRYLVEEREEILTAINNSNFDEDEIKRIGKELNLIELEKQMKKMLEFEKTNIKRKIANLKKMQQGNNGYMSIGYVQPRFNKFS